MMKQIDLSFRIAMDDENGNLGEVRKKLLDPKSEYFDQRTDISLLLQKYQVLVFVDQERVPQGVIVFPRDPKRREQVGGIQSLNLSGDSFSSSLKSKELTELIEKHRANLVAF
jgi:hypothetical protein